MTNKGKHSYRRAVTTPPRLAGDELDKFLNEVAGRIIQRDMQGIFILHAELLQRGERGDRVHYAALYAALGRLQVLRHMPPCYQDELARRVLKMANGHG